MSSETVNDMRLEELIERYEAVEASYRNEFSELSKVESVFIDAQRRVLDVIGLLTELKSLRAQQAEPPAGCAEMATTIEKAIADADESGFDEGRCAIIAAKLAPLFTLLALCRPRIVHEVTCATQDHEMYPKSTEVKTWLDSQVALLAKLDAAIGKGDADGGREEEE